MGHCKDASVGDTLTCYMVIGLSVEEVPLTAEGASHTDTSLVVQCFTGHQSFLEDVKVSCISKFS